MSLTDAERAEFIRLTKDSYDPELWTEEDLPLLLRLEKERQEAERRERESAIPKTSDTVPNEKPGSSLE